MELAIRTDALTKYYGRVRGCQDINLAVPVGSIYGFLGLNGAGKSTVVKLLAGLLLPTAGQGSLFGHPIGQPAAKRLLGFVPEHYRMPEWAAAEDLLVHYGRLAGLGGSELRARCTQVLGQVGLGEFARRRVGQFSNGMRQRLALGAALLHRPRLLILDEPTAALDPLGRRFVRTLLQELRQEGITIFLNSHLLGELEQLCDQVAIIRQGSIVAAGSMQELGGGHVEVLVRAEPCEEGLLQALAALSPARPPVRGANGQVTICLESMEQVPLVAAAVQAAGSRLYELTPRTRSLEDLFVDLVTTPGEGVQAGA